MQLSSLFLIGHLAVLKFSYRVIATNLREQLNLSLVNVILFNSLAQKKNEFKSPEGHDYIDKNVGRGSIKRRSVLKNRRSSAKKQKKVTLGQKVVKVVFCLKGGEETKE